MRRRSVQKFDPENPVESFKQILRDLMKGYEFNVQGLLLKDGSVRALPREASVVGKVLEVSISEYFHRRLLLTPQLSYIPASSDRVYPDLSFKGSMIHPFQFALDIKCARRVSSGEKTESAITIGTFDAEYFRYPDEKVANIMAAYSSYTAHLALIALYTYTETTAKDIEILVVEKWRVATKKKASGTRCYIAASKSIAALRKEQGDFSSEEEFNSFWRSQDISLPKESRWNLRRGRGPEG
jgi:hypothetical protein